MIDAYEVMKSVKTLYSPAEEDGDLLPLCFFAAGEISPRLRSTASPDDTRILTLAAAEVYCLLLAKREVSEDEPDSFRAGDVTVKNDRKRKTAEAESIRRQAYLNAVPCLRDDEFMFVKVKI